MTGKNTVHAEKIESVLKICRTANDTYFYYLKKYAEEAQFNDKKKRVENEKVDIVFTMMLKKLATKSIAKESKRYNELRTPELHAINPNLNDIYNTIEQILARRGWPSKPPHYVMLKQPSNK